MRTRVNRRSNGTPFRFLSLVGAMRTCEYVLYVVTALMFLSLVGAMRTMNFTLKSAVELFLSLVGAMRT